MKKIWETVNRILTALSVVILALWVWKFFGPGGAKVRAMAQPSMFGGLRRMFALGVAVCCVGYLAWRALVYFYFGRIDEDDDEE